MVKKEQYVDWFPLFNAACFILLAAGAVGGGMIAKKLSDNPSDSKAKKISYCSDFHGFILVLHRECMSSVVLYQMDQVCGGKEKI